MPDEGLAPLPLGDEIRLDDPAEDEARADASVADLVEQDLDDPATPSTRAALAAGFLVPTEPVGRDDQRPINDVNL